MFSLQLRTINHYICFEAIQLVMRIERTTKEVIITLPATVNTEDLQEFLNYTRYKELTAGIDVKQELSLDNFSDEDIRNN